MGSDGFDSQIFDQKLCKHSANGQTIGVIRTNFGHTFASWSMTDWRQNEYDDICSTGHVQSFLFTKAYKSTPRILENRIYILPNEFDCNLLQNHKVLNIFAMQSRKPLSIDTGIVKNNFPGNEKI